MKLRHGIWGPAIALVMATTPSPAAAKDLWIHVKAQDGGARHETVRVNIPLSVLESVAPFLKNTHIDMNKVKVGDKKFGSAELRDLWKAVRSAQDGEYVTVEAGGESVRVAKSGDHLLVKARETRNGKNQNVDITLPLAVVDALLSGSDDNLNFTAAIRALQARGEGELVAVNDEDSTVRIWIDAVGGER